MSPVLTRPDRPTTRPGRSRIVLGVAGALAAVLVLLDGIAFVVRGPSFVPRVSIENTTPYRVDVEAAAVSDPAVVDLAAVPPGGRIDVREVVDQGDRWVFHFTAGPFDGGSVTIDRSDLERQGWRLQIPPLTAERLATAGAASSSG
jgi:hypothetical protein